MQRHSIWAGREDDRVQRAPATDLHSRVGGQREAAQLRVLQMEAHSDYG